MDERGKEEEHSGVFTKGHSALSQIVNGFFYLFILCLCAVVRMLVLCVVFMLSLYRRFCVSFLFSSLFVLYSFLFCFFVFCLYHSFITVQVLAHTSLLGWWTAAAVDRRSCERNA